MKEVILKGDSSLLPNRKPFFLPEGAQEVQAFPCQAIRIGRLGRCISPRFVMRYVDGIAEALDIQDVGLAAQLRKAGLSLTPAQAFEGAFPIGTFRPIEPDEVLPTEAIVAASKVMTLRPGDVVYVQYAESPIVLQEGLVIERSGLYCKIV